MHLMLVTFWLLHPFLELFFMKKKLIYFLLLQKVY